MTQTLYGPFVTLLTMTTYSEIDDLASVYLEESFIFEITESPTTLHFRGEFVLLENHPQYRLPPSGVQYCYADGWLILPNLSRIDWIHRSTQRFTDANGEQDLGNIDYFLRHNDYWLVGGDWGQTHAYTSDNPTLKLNQT